MLLNSSKIKALKYYIFKILTGQNASPYTKPRICGNKWNYKIEIPKKQGSKLADYLGSQAGLFLLSALE